MEATMPLRFEVEDARANSATKTAADGVRDRVASATLASLVRVAGGGYAVASAGADDDAIAYIDGDGIGGVDHRRRDDDESRRSWTKELEKIALSSVSFPNGADGESTEGKPHDAEVRAAPTLFHRIRRGSGRKGKELRKRKKDRSNETESPSSREENFEVISDLGTRREIHSARTLADLISLELEKELTNGGNHGGHDELTDDETNVNQRGIEHTSQPSFADVRPSDSGIICLVSDVRSERLLAAGRLPCPKCVKWFRGAKGLWWHMLSAHGVEYSSAAGDAAGAANPLAIVPFREPRGSILETPTMGSQFQAKEAHHNVPGTDGSSNGSAAQEMDAFELVKSGNLDDFVDLIERGFRPEGTLDRNGASVLHWSAGCGRLDFVSFLVEKCGCCPNEAQRGKRSFMGRTPLHWAARNGHLNVVEYLVNGCRVNIDAKTSDGTTAFCWAAWQGHLDVMKFLHRSGCDIHAANGFGCNAALWSAQGAGTAESMAWLLECGSDFRLVNSNGHGALHKAAQRGCGAAVRWLASAFLSDDDDASSSSLVAPDAEGNCPSDLCGMEGRETLARWISHRECDYFARRSSSAKSVEDLAGDPRVPPWLRKELREANACATSRVVEANDRWGAGRGARRMALNLLGRFARSASDEVTKEPINDFNDID